MWRMKEWGEGKVKERGKEGKGRKEERWRTEEGGLWQSVLLHTFRGY